MAYFDGVTKDGVHIHIEDDPYAIKPDSDPRILFDGEEVEVKRIGRRRDGGSTEILTERGRLYINGRFYTEPSASLDGEPIEVKEGGGGKRPNRV